MKVPDLAAELAYWVPRMRLDAPPRPWAITMRYEPDPRDPADGAPVWGLNRRNLDARTADIVIRTPTSDAECLEAIDTIAHELLHCLHAAAEAPIEVEEGIVWTLAPLLTQLRTSDPARAATLLKAITKTTMRAPASARKGMTMDPAKLAELMLKLGEMMAKENLSDEMKGVLQELIAMAAGGSVEVPAAEGAETTTDGGMPGQPALGTDTPTEKPMYKPKPATVAKVEALPAKDQELVLLKEQLAADRAAAVDAVLDGHPQLSPQQRERLRETGVEKGVAVLRKDLVLFAPSSASAVIKPEGGQRLGLPAAPRGGTGAEGIQSSGDPKMQTLFRIQQRDPTKTGVTVPEDGSALVRFSVVDAFAKIKAHAVAKAFGKTVEGAK